ncbi:MAG: bifunctional diaminohydroxyphosphoribosylaminopyrimidine deaminase/5-amino-6-(5-phosphoribosylamino)uracil reductase RibD [Phycisphaerales bacterium]|jgi:diaminohydroxyphosphoribosylaminopyrimidine deaminase/5-amino-6-(5-phosphoribosylamino)uracil reductase|nr:bifunctional diaminohydroxyphosphoribosylaminopyrimidine deaminase/5-amino-6-(5-phosphoribosylamino)uracil reductase RibD [Phycisphaerales bacterium]
MQHESYLKHLHHACELAARGHGCVEPNPMVGCVIVNPKGIIVGRGYHQKIGDSHAEIHALQEAGAQARGSTVFVTLEPCNHQGKTGPCAPALLNAGVSTVVIGCSDPNPEATGGIAFLKKNGVHVLLADDPKCKKLIAPFVQRVTTGLPWVLCKWAQTADGYIETPIDESPWISSAESRQLVHQERGCVDAIIVGVGTVVADNPSLTVRGSTAHRTPLRVIIDPTLRTPCNANLCDGSIPTLIAHGKGANPNAFPQKNISFIELPSIENALNLRPLLTHVAKEYDATNVLVEGGKSLFEHLFKQQLANELWIFTSNKTFGDKDLRNMQSTFEHVPCVLEQETSCGGDVVQRYRVEQEVSSLSV